MGRETGNRSTPNPIYEHFTRGSRWPTMRQSRWLAVGLVFACTTLMGWLPSALNYYSFISSLILSFGLVVISPVLFAVNAVNFTHRMIRNIDYRMIQLTPLNDDDIFEGFNQVALFRLRIPRMLAAGLMPVTGLLFTAILNWDHQPDYVPHVVTAIIGVGYAVVGWIGQWVSISLGVNFVEVILSHWTAMFLAVLTALFMSGVLYFVSGFAACILVLLTFFLPMPMI